MFERDCLVTEEGPAVSSANELCALVIPARDVSVDQPSLMMSAGDAPSLIFDGERTRVCMLDRLIPLIYSINIITH